MNALTFWWKTGTWPQNDNLERVNCDQAGFILHTLCGWCKEHDTPRFRCMCIAKLPPYGNHDEKFR